MLTPEERQRIEEEERKRIAEEQYRDEVRATLTSNSGAPAKQPSRLPWILSIGAILIVGAIFWTNNSRRPTPGPKTRYVPASQKIATGQIIVKAREDVQYRLTITPEMAEATVKGIFNASGGFGNDIQGVIADETNYTNWINGHQAQVLWQTQGWQTTGTFDVKLAPGTYYVVFNNRPSLLADKQVFLEVDLNYKKAEIYYE